MQTIEQSWNEPTTFFKAISKWNGVYRTLEVLPHPNPYVQCGKRPLPRLFEIFPDAKEQIVANNIKNLATSTIEGVHNFIASTVILQLARVWLEDGLQSSDNRNHY
jgi:hypothetical protein